MDYRNASFLYEQAIEIEQDIVTDFSSNKITDSSINVNLHHPLEDTGLCKRQLNNMQIVLIRQRVFRYLKGMLDWLATRTGDVLA